MASGDTPATDRRRGFGQLSSIDLLPEECDEDIAWANAALRERKMPQQEVLRAFNARLADKGVKAITRSAFSRHSVRLAIELRRMDASRRVSELVLRQTGPGDRSDTMIAATELLKFRVHEMMMAAEGSEPDPDLLIKASLTLQRLSAIAAREAEAARREQKHEQARADREAEQAERDRARAEAEQAAEAAAKIAGEAGLSAERVEAIRKGVLGLAG